MGKPHAKIISKTAFEKAFVEAEMIMRRNLAHLIQTEIGNHVFSEEKTDDGYVAGLQKAKTIVFGEVVES